MNDNELLLAILRSDAQLTGDYLWWTHAGILHAAMRQTGHGLTIHSRVSDLRKQGHNIECRVSTVNGRKESSYRLVSEAGGADLPQPVVGRAEPATKTWTLPTGAGPREMTRDEIADALSALPSSDRPEQLDRFGISDTLFTTPRGAYDD